MRMPPNPLETFVGLDRFQVIARLSEDGQTREAVRAQTLPPIEHHVGRREKLIARSREKYSAKHADAAAGVALNGTFTPTAL